VTAVAAPPVRRSAVTPWLSTAARVVLGTVLLVAGAAKVVDPQASVAAVRAYELLPDGLATGVGWGLPFVEVMLGVVLLAGIAVRPAAFATAVLLAGFVAAVASAAARGLSIDCGCFGGGGPVPPGQTAYAAEIVRDLALLAVAAWLVVRPHSRLTLGRDR
jgi:uncharacterized membrane protein YphA (DoxX/SURF4 family)